MHHARVTLAAVHLVVKLNFLFPAYSSELVIHALSPKESQT